MYRDNTVTDISLLPPCKSSLRKHANCANFIAGMWRKAHQTRMIPEEPQFHGWMTDLQIDWIDEPFPDDIVELLMGKEDEGDDESSADESNYSSSSDEED